MIRHPRISIRAGASVTAMLAASLCAASASAQSDALAYYRSLPEGAVRAIEYDMIWAGVTDAVVDGTIGTTDIERIEDFEADAGLRVDGVLERAERRALERRAELARANAGYEVVRDPATGVRLGLPRGLVGASEAVPQGRRWSSPDDRLRVRSYRLPPDRTLREAYLNQLDRPEGDVTYEVFRDEWFVVAGRQGSSRFYVRARTDGEEVRSFSVVYDPALDATIEPVIVAMSNDFDPFPGNPRPAPEPGVAARAPDGCGNRYRVRRGDTFYAIALRCGVRVPALQRANPDADPRGLAVGQVLRVPDARGTFPPAPATPAAGAGGVSATLVSAPPRVGGSVEVRATGFQPDAVVEAGFGRTPDRFVVTRIARADARGTVALTMTLPSRFAAGERALVAFADPDGTVGATTTPFTVRPPRVQAVAPTPPPAPRREALVLVGMLTTEGERCLALRDEGGTLYTLAGDTDDYAPGTAVRVEALRGTRAQSARCGQGETVQVQAIARR